MMWYWNGGVHWWGWLLGFAVMIAFWGLIVWGAWYLLSGMTSRPTEGRPDTRDAKAILDERVARGEIDAEEYRRLLGLIRGEGSLESRGGPPVGAGSPG